MLTVTSWKYVGFCVYSSQQRFLLVVAQLLEERKAGGLLPAGKQPREVPAGCTQRVGDWNTHMSSWEVLALR